MNFFLVGSTSASERLARGIIVELVSTPVTCLAPCWMQRPDSIPVPTPMSKTVGCLPSFAMNSLMQAFNASEYLQFRSLSSPIEKKYLANPLSAGT